MKLETRYLGEIEVDKSNTINFPAGIPGFLNEKEFVLIDLPENPVFQILQSARSEAIAFVVASPFYFYPDYAFDLDANILESLQIERENDVVILVIATLKNPFEKSTLNLKAPLIINSKNKRGKQYILNMDDYPSKAPIVLSDSINGKENGDACINKEAK